MLILLIVAVLWAVWSMLCNPYYQVGGWAFLWFNMRQGIQTFLIWQGRFWYSFIVWCLAQFPMLNWKLQHALICASRVR